MKKAFYKKKRYWLLIFIILGLGLFIYPFTQDPLGHFQRSVAKVLSYAGIEEHSQASQKDFFHYWEAGKKTKQHNTLLLLHGFGGNSLWTWMRLMPSLSQERHLLALDLLASRFMQIKPQTYSVQAEADHVLRFLEKQQVKKIDIIALSVGGWIALKIAHEHPDKVGRLILIESAGLTTEIPSFARLTLDNRERAQDFMNRLFYHPPPVPDFALDALVKASNRIKKHYLKTLDFFIKNSAPQVMDEKIKDIFQKTLILHGRQDQVIPLEHA
ncbi:MAG: alpha/beta fold hydrolase [Deltaproteobacteria bacterium]|nr:alpha/beta fold hydrolase [Deltaproteobacteria bacterium]